jgi:hypothetical protein
VDDTGARHRRANGVCTQIGNDDFAWSGARLRATFATTASKSRLNFLDLLRAGHTDYVINDAALAYMHERALAGPVIRQLAAHSVRQFADQTAWQRHLACLGIGDLRVMPDPVSIATEGALWGAVTAHGFLRQAVVVSDDAGKFDIGQHALCWIHAERLVHKLDTFTDAHHAAQQYVRGLIWWFYADLKAYCAEPTLRRRSELRARFDRIFRRRTGFVTLDRLLQRLHANKPELLMVVARSARDPTAHQRLGERYPLPGDQAAGQRWNSERHRPRLPRCLPRPHQDLSQTRHRILGLPRRPPRHPGNPRRVVSPQPHPLVAATRLDARATPDSAPLTTLAGGPLRRRFTAK